LYRPKSRNHLIFKEKAAFGKIIFEHYKKEDLFLNMAWLPLFDTFRDMAYA